MTPKHRKLSNLPTLPEKLNRQTKLYAAAAAAAGVGILALAQPAQGEVIITKKTIPIPISNFDGQQFLVPLDLNHDGVTDLSFILSTFAYHSFNAVLEALPAKGAAVVGAPGEKSNFYASALLRGARIGPSAHFSSKGAADLERSQGGDSSSRYSLDMFTESNASPAGQSRGHDRQGAHGRPGH